MSGTKMLSWSSAFTHFVQQNAANERILNNILEENIHEVIDSLGGLSNIIQLCLTNPNASTSIDKDRFVTFETIMRKNGISFDSLDGLPNNEKKSNNTEIVIVYDNDNVETQMVDMMEKQMSNEIYNNSYVKHIRQFKANNTHNRKTIENKWIAIIDNLSEFYKSRLILKVKAKEKIIFQLFGIGGYIENELQVTNIVLFSSKYWFKDIYHLLRKLISACTTSNGSHKTAQDMNTIHSNSHDNTNANYQNCSRCVSLYRRPYILWQ